MASGERNSGGDRVIDRRQLLRVGAGATLLGSAPAWLAACGAGSSGAKSKATNSGSPPVGGGAGATSGPGTGAKTAAGGAPSGGSSGLPAYVPWQVVTYDLPGTDAGVPPAMFAYPADPQRIHPHPVVKDLTVSILKTGDTAQPPTGSHNPFLQYLQQQVGATLNITQIAGADYNSKIATTLAGGDLPDMIQMLFAWPNLPDALKADFVDLSPWLAGDGVKNWPGLAKIPTFGWSASTIDGGLWGIPYVIADRVGNGCLIRQDIFDDLGIKAEAVDGNAFMDICKELTDVKKHRWAITDLLSSTVQFASGMSGVPNGWKEVNGKFTSAYETDEYKQMMEYANQIYSKGYVYPDATTTLAQGQTLLMGGTGTMIYQAGGNWSNLLARSQDPKFQPGGLVLPMWNGSGQAVQYVGSGLYTFTALKKGTSPERLKQLLDVLDWFASPWGSWEQELFTYGQPGRDFTLDKTDPVATQTGIQECFNFRLDYLSAGLGPLYTAGRADVTKACHAYQLKIMKNIAPLPTAGLYSNTQVTKGATANKTITNVRNDIIQGRKKVSEWAAAVKAWRNAGGDEIRAEYEQAFAAKRPGS